MVPKPTLAVPIQADIAVQRWSQMSWIKRAHRVTSVLLLRFLNPLLSYAYVYI